MSHELQFGEILKRLVFETSQRLESLTFQIVDVYCAGFPYHYVFQFLERYSFNGSFTRIVVPILLNPHVYSKLLCYRFSCEGKITRGFSSGHVKPYILSLRIY